MLAHIFNAKCIQILHIILWGLGLLGGVSDVMHWGIASQLQCGVEVAQPR